MYLEHDYPAIYNHLCQYKEKLKNRGQCRYTSSGKQRSDRPYSGQHHWLELDNNPCDDYLNDFSKPKIVYREISTDMDACIVEEEVMVNNKCYIVTGVHLYYLAAFFNSRLFNKIILPQANTTGGKGEKFIQSIYSPIPNNEIELKLNKLLNLRQNNSNTEKIDTEIELIICSLLNLTSEELSYIIS